MADFQIAWNAATKTATVQAAGATLPSGSVKIADEDHNHPDDSLGEYGKSHVAYHHVRDALYRLDPSFQDMALVTIVSDVSITLTDFATTPDNATIAPAGTVQLVNVFVPANVIDKAVTYLSSTPAVATVNGTGLVTGVANGVAVVTVTHTETGLSDACEVTVATAVSSISSTPATANLAPLATQQIATAFTPTTASNKGLTYLSSAPAVATVSASGLITAVAAGSAVITITSDDGAKTDTVAVTVA